MSLQHEPYANTQGSGFRFWSRVAPESRDSYPFEIPIMRSGNYQSCSGWLLVRIEIALAEKKKSIVGQAWKHRVTVRVIDRTTGNPVRPIRSVLSKLSYPKRRDAMAEAIGVAKATHEALKTRGVRKVLVDKYLSEYTKETQ